MGCWNGTDMITHLPIMGGDKIRMLVLKQYASLPDCGGVCNAEDLWEPIGPAVKGVYNGYGRPEEVEDDIASQWLNHTLPMDAEIRKNIEGHHFDGELDEKILAVERSQSMLVKRVHLCHWMVHEDTWQFLQSIEVEYFELSPKERVKALLDVGPVEHRREEPIKWMKQQTAIQSLFSYGSMPNAVIQFAGKDNFEAAVMALVELKRVKDAMETTRRYFMPVAGAGSQSAEWEIHQQLARFTIKLADKAMEKYK